MLLNAQIELINQSINPSQTMIRIGPDRAFHSSAIAAAGAAAGAAGMESVSFSFCALSFEMITFQPLIVC